MQDAVLDFLSSTLIPVLGADIATSTAGNIHLGLVGIAALGAFPNQLAIVFADLDLTIKTAALAVVALG